MTAAENRMPVHPELGGRCAEGYFTPCADKVPQCFFILPKRVLPVIFLPGMMGSNLRINNAERLRQLEKNNNIAWRPDDKGEALGFAFADAAQRQLQLDPATTEVDEYDPNGPDDISGDGRHDNVSLPKEFDSVLLMDDPPTAKPRRSAVQKARERGWGEVYFASYGELLKLLESRLNHTFNPDGSVHEGWSEVVGVDPAIWRADPERKQAPLDAQQLTRFADKCWFPVHAFGYNWLQDVRLSAEAIARRIDALIKRYRQWGYQCEKVIVVTHSMGGLVGRALVHPDMGGIQEKVLGVVHGVLPSLGAPAAYRRMRAGFEDPGLLMDFMGSMAAKIIGNHGDEVTAVLANAPGLLQLLPNQAYGNGWLQVEYRGLTQESWPKNGDPYEEIYKLRNRWYGLIREEWINPANVQIENEGGAIRRTHKYLDRAKSFHIKLGTTYHPCTYAHYGDDPKRASFSKVVWEISDHCTDTRNWKEWPIAFDNRQGGLELQHPNSRAGEAMFSPHSDVPLPRHVSARILPPDGAGDQTVPAKSAEHQRAHAQAVFRQHGYEHQASYQDRHALACTLYSIVRIGLTMSWSPVSAAACTADAT